MALLAVMGSSFLFHGSFSTARFLCCFIFLNEITHGNPGTVLYFVYVIYSDFY
eukprot:UN15143